MAVPDTVTASDTVAVPDSETAPGGVPAPDTVTAPDSEAAGWPAAVLAPARHQAQALADRQARAVAQLDRLLATVAGHRERLRAAQEAEGRISAEVQAAADRVTAADLAVSERMGLLLDAYRSSLSGLDELRVADPGELIAALESWGATGEGANPAIAIVGDAARAAGQDLGRVAERSPAEGGHTPSGHAKSPTRSAGCARAATTRRLFRIPAPLGSATTVPAHRYGR